MAEEAGQPGCGHELFVLSSAFVRSPPLPAGFGFACCLVQGSARGMGGSKHLGTSKNYPTWSLLCMLALNFCFLGPDNQPLQHKMVVDFQLRLQESTVMSWRAAGMCPCSTCHIHIYVCSCQVLDAGHPENCSHAHQHMCLCILLITRLQAYIEPLLLSSSCP